MKTLATLSAMSKCSILQRSIALLLFTVLLSTSKNSFACNASFVDSIYGTSVQFINTSQASNTAYWYWTFGDGTSSDLENPVHVYNSSDPYLVCLIVYDTAENCVADHCDTIYFNPIGCSASFYFNVQLNTVEFTNTSQADNSATWYWSFGDGATSDTENPTHEYSISGAYYVCLTVTDTANNCSDTYCQYVQVAANGGCSASFYPIDSGNLVYFYNQSQASNTATWIWSFGDGTSSDQENPIHEYNSVGPFVVCLTVYDTANNCSDTHCDSLYINNGGGCQAYFTHSTNGLTVDFTNLSAGNYSSVVWTFGDNTTSYFNNPSHTYANYGYYYVCVTVSDTGNNCNSTWCQYVYVNDTVQLCDASFNYTATGNEVHFFNYSSACDSATWFWQFGDGAISTNFDPSHEYASSGYYYVCLTVVDVICGCSDSVCYLVYAGGNNFACNAEFVLYPDSFQQGLYWGYNYSTGNNLVYYWSWGDGTSSTGQYPSHTYADSGYYTICLSIYDTLTACSDSFCSNYYIMKQAKMMGMHEVIFVDATGVPPVNQGLVTYWSIFPNPASNAIRIETNAEKIDEVGITDVSGKVMKQISSYTGDFISLESLSQGVYIVQTLIGDTWSSKLLIKQ